MIERKNAPPTCLDLGWSLAACALATRETVTTGTTFVNNAAVEYTWLAAACPAAASAEPSCPMKKRSTAPVMGKMRKLMNAGIASVQIRLSSASPHGNDWMRGSGCDAADWRSTGGGAVVAMRAADRR